MNSAAFALTCVVDRSMTLFRTTAITIPDSDLYPVSVRARAGR